jgi:hypothetical protein
MQAPHFLKAVAAFLIPLVAQIVIAMQQKEEKKRGSWAGVTAFYLSKAARPY